MEYWPVNDALVVTVTVQVPAAPLALSVSVLCPTPEKLSEKTCAPPSSLTLNVTEPDPRLAAYETLAEPSQEKSSLLVLAPLPLWAMLPSPDAVWPLDEFSAVHPAKATATSISTTKMRMARDPRPVAKNRSPAGPADADVPGVRALPIAGPPYSLSMRGARRYVMCPLPSAMSNSNLTG